MCVLGEECSVDVGGLDISVHPVDSFRSACVLYFSVLFMFLSACLEVLRVPLKKSVAGHERPSHF